jgi:hypothetical protein
MGAEGQMNELTQKLVVSIVIIPILLGIFRSKGEMTLSIAAIGLALFFVNLDRFTRFKTPGFEAELQTVVNKAYAAISELKELGLNLSAPIVDGLAISGRMLQYIPLKFKLERVEKIATNLKALGASQEEIDKATATIFDRVNQDHVGRIVGALKNANPDKPTTLFDGLEAHADWDAKAFEKFIADNSLTADEETKQWLLDLGFFRTTHKLRREDRWQS